MIKKLTKKQERIESVIMPITSESVNRWMKECHEGKHPLSPEDKAALERSRGKLLRDIKSILKRYERYENEKGKDLHEHLDL